MSWKVDLSRRVAIHQPTGLVYHFKKDETTPGAWDGECINPEHYKGPLDAQALARISREGGDAFLAELKKQNEKLTELRASQDGELAAEIRKRRERAGLTWKQLAIACDVHIRAAQGWGSGEYPPGEKHLEMLDAIFGEQ